MPYALRNQEGEIIALTGTPTHENAAMVSLDDPEVLHFLTRDTSASEEPSKKKMALLAQDIQEIRIIEDLIELLTLKGIILFSELPVAAQEKILRKKSTREQKGDTNDIIVDDRPFL